MGAYKDDTLNSDLLVVMQEEPRSILGSTPETCRHLHFCRLVLYRKLPRGSRDVLYVGCMLAPMVLDVTLILRSMSLSQNFYFLTTTKIVKYKSLDNITRDL